ncbi:aldose 1-epimerase family protein [bacterium]|nr:aldose 1-epimerase family protein [bacterium]
MSGLVATLCLCSAIITAEPYSHVITSVQQNIAREELEIKSSDVSPDSPTPWKIRKQTLHGGKQEGVDLVTIDNGAISIVVIPTRGMGIWQVRHSDIRLGWESPVKEIVHPQFVNLATRGGLGWLEGFGEFMCRCGLESNGHPGQDVIVDNTGAKSTVDLTLHGKQANLPAQEVKVVVEKAAPYRIRLIGQIAERMMHGPKFDLRTEISTTPGSTSFRVTDVITNASVNPAEFELLYHCNYGAPLLEEGSEFIAPVKKVFPLNARAAEGDIKKFGKFAGPTPGYAEQVYCCELFGDNEGKTTAALVNAKKDRAASIRYSVKELPHLTLWKNTAAADDGYVTGIEPGTNYPYNRKLERAAGRVPKIPGHGEYQVTVDFDLHIGPEAVTNLIGGISKIQGNQKTDFIAEPQTPVVK